jgi:hypothetical protein
MRPLRRVLVFAAVLLQAFAVCTAVLVMFPQAAKAQTLPLAPGRMGHYGKPFPATATLNSPAASTNASPVAAQGLVSAGAVSLVHIQKITEDGIAFVRAEEQL